MQEELGWKVRISAKFFTHEISVKYLPVSSMVIYQCQAHAMSITLAVHVNDVPDDQ